MKIEIVIPTYKREEKLGKCIESIRKAWVQGVHLNIFYSIRDEWLEMGEKYRDDFINHIMYKQKYTAPTFWNYYLEHNFNGDVFVYLNDDVEIEHNCLRLIGQTFKFFIKDFDGVVGIHQKNIPNTDNRLAFGAIGKEFIQRFPNNHVFCPEYKCLYIDEELEDYARIVDKAWTGRGPTLIHHHPCTGVPEDETHRHNRIHKSRDIQTYSMRKRKNLTWGMSFKTVNKGE